MFPQAPDHWPAARAQLRRALEVAPDWRDAAAAYFESYPDHPPDYFHDNRRALARQAFDHGTGWACRLLSCLESPAHFTLHAHHLDLDRGAAESALLFDRPNIAIWKQAILSAFTGPLRWKLELGSGGRIHAHIIADASELPELPRGGRVVSPCESYFEAAVKYVLKPPLEYNPEHLAIWLEAKKRGRLPALSGSHGIPNRRTWSNPSKLRDYFAFDPPNRAPESPQIEPARIQGIPAPESQPSPPNSPLSRSRSHPRRVPFTTFSNPLEKTPRRVFEPCTRRVSRACRHRKPRARGPPSTRDHPETFRPRQIGASDGYNSRKNQQRTFPPRETHRKRPGTPGERPARRVPSP